MHIQIRKRPANDSLIEGAIWRKMLIFFLPIMCGTILQQLYNMADTVIVSIFVGKQALAAVGGSSAIITKCVQKSGITLPAGMGPNGRITPSAVCVRQNCLIAFSPSRYSPKHS